MDWCVETDMPLPRCLFPSDNLKHGFRPYHYFGLQWSKLEQPVADRGSIVTDKTSHS